MSTDPNGYRPAIIIMTRIPRPGEGKSRLRGALSDDECFRLQEAFVRDAVAVALECDVGPVHIAFTPAEAASWPKEEFGGRIVAFPQAGNDLGARMLAALRHVEALGFVPQVMTGTDTPLLQPRHLRTALSALSEADLCLGPSADGGYYLMACRTATAALFEGVPWGTNNVLEATKRRARDCGLRLSMLDRLYDIDTPDDLKQLRRELSKLSKEPAFWPPKHTAALILD